MGSRFEPTSQGSGRFARATASQQPLYTDILVEEWPVNADSSTDHFIPETFLRTARHESWKPGDGHGDRAAVIELHGHRFVGEQDGQSECVSLSDRSGHATPPGFAVRESRRSDRSDAVHDRQIPVLMPVAQARAKIWPMLDPYARGRAGAPLRLRSRRKVDTALCRPRQASVEQNRRAGFVLKRYT
jgi:hypothetical protein